MKISKVTKVTMVYVFSLTLLISLYSGSARAAKRVKGYTDKNGRYVQPHHRSDPDGYRYNNYGRDPNINPYTGKQGKN